MKLKKIGNNETELTLNDGSQILFSYETPVCVRTEAMHCGQMQTRVCVTAEKYSRTTTGHINKCPTRKAPGSKNARWGQCE